MPHDALLTLCPLYLDSPLRTPADCTIEGWTVKDGQSHADVIAKLLQLGPPNLVNVGGTNGDSPLIRGARIGAPPALAVILHAAGCDPEVVNRAGSRAILWVAQNVRDKRG
jgi:hypothetical protein